MSKCLIAAKIKGRAEEELDAVLGNRWAISRHSLLDVGLAAIRIVQCQWGAVIEIARIWRIV